MAEAKIAVSGNSAARDHVPAHPVDLIRLQGERRVRQVVPKRGRK